MFLLLFIVKSPNGQQLPLRSTLLLTLLPIILIIVILLVLLILANHSLHDLHASLKRDRVPAALRFLVRGFLVVVLLVLLFLVLFFLTLEFLNVLVPDLPLGDLAPQVVRDRGLGGCAFLLDVGVDSLDLATLVVELVAHRLLYGLDVFAGARLLLLSLTSELLEVLFSVYLDFLLDLVLVVCRMNVVPLQTEVRDHLVNAVVNLVLALAVVIHDLVGRCLRISHHQSAVDAQVQLRLGQAGVLRHVLGLIVLLFVDHVDLGLVGHLGFLGRLLDPQNVLVGADGFLGWLPDRTHDG